METTIVIDKSSPDTLNDFNEFSGIILSSTMTGMDNDDKTSVGQEHPRSLPMFQADSFCQGQIQMSSDTSDFENMMAVQISNGLKLNAIFEAVSQYVALH